MSDQRDDGRAADDAPDLGRRAWLLRLGLFAAAAYAAPTVLQIGSTAEAQGRGRDGRGRQDSDSDSDNRRRRGRSRRRQDSESDDRRRRRRSRSYGDGRRTFW